MLLLARAGMARYLNASVPGIVVPRRWCGNWKKRPRAGCSVGAAILARHIRFLRDRICDGVHIMALGSGSGAADTRHGRGTLDGRCALVARRREPWARRLRRLWCWAGARRLRGGHQHRGGAGVTVVESGPLGGTCLNRGCIPTKTLIAGVDAGQGARRRAMGSACPER